MIRAGLHAERTERGLLAPLFFFCRADNTIRSGSRKATAINALLTQIRNLRHWEDGERKVGQKWVAYKKPSDETKEKYKSMRLKAQQRVIELMGRK